MNEGTRSGKSTICHKATVLWDPQTAFTFTFLPSGYHGYRGVVFCGVHAEAEETVEHQQFFVSGANWGWWKSWASTVYCSVAQPDGSIPMDNINGLFAVIISTRPVTQSVQLHVHTVAARRVTARV
jgi:hypothetical protein